jgi:hypothetical protein
MFYLQVSEKYEATEREHVMIKVIYFDIYKTNIINIKKILLYRYNQTCLRVQPKGANKSQIPKFELFYFSSNFNPLFC